MVLKNNTKGIINKHLKSAVITTMKDAFEDSDSAINYTPVRYEDTFSPLVPPPVPEYQLIARPIQLPDGTIQTDIEISDTTNTSGYPIAVKPVYQYAVPSDFSDILQVNP